MQCLKEVSFVVMLKKEQFRLVYGKYGKYKKEKCS